MKKSLKNAREICKLIVRNLSRDFIAPISHNGYQNEGRVIEGSYFEQLSYIVKDTKFEVHFMESTEEPTFSCSQMGNQPFGTDGASNISYEFNDSWN
ncbi:MAG: hypothetical protein P8M72_12255 [Gammaproteobacteria bacterium]|nr:hypothetical protein [Gammaproteobacteria bacterium]